MNSVPLYKERRSRGMNSHSEAGADYRGRKEEYREQTNDSSENWTQPLAEILGDRMWS